MFCLPQICCPLLGHGCQRVIKALDEDGPPAASRPKFIQGWPKRIECSYEVAETCAERFLQDHIRIPGGTVDVTSRASRQW